MVEKDVLSSVCGHPFIVILYSSFQTEESLFFVMELAQGGDLVMLKLTEPVATFYAAEIALALKFLHKKGIVHRDLKPENVLLDKEGHIKVSDFGVASLGLFGKDRMSTFYGSSDCVAPEMAQGLEYKHDIDWWAVGIMIYEMLLGYEPFQPHGGFSTLESIVYDDIRYPQWLSKEVMSILQGAHLFFVMKLALGGDLRSKLNLEKTFSQELATFYAAEIALALQFPHKKGIVHRDLKPGNILLDKEGHIKVTDFGLSISGLFEGDKTRGCCGTAAYVVPEMAQGLEYKHDVDWWALGIMIYEMLVGSKPFYPDGGFNTLKWIDYDGIRYPEWLSKEAESILQGFLNKDPQSRLTDHDRIRSHPFFAALKWKQLGKKQVKPPETKKIVETSKHQVDIAPLAPAEPVHPDLQV